LVRKRPSFHPLFYFANLHTVELFVPLFEWCGVNLYNTALHQSVGTHQLITGGVVHYIHDTRPFGSSFSWPNKMTFIETKSSVFVVTTTSPYEMNPFFTNFGESWSTTKLEFSLATDYFATTSRSTALV
jgi:hypothetical protein